MRLEPVSRFASQNQNQTEAREDDADMFYPEITVMFSGKPQSLKAWCNEMGGCYTTVLYRWHQGIRTPEDLLRGTRLARKEITKQDLQYLRETRFAREGQPDEWEIACDLIGVPHSRARELKGILG